MTGPEDFFMTPDYPESPFSYTMKDARGDLFTVRGIDWDDFYKNLAGVIAPERVEAVQEELRTRIDNNKGPQGAASAPGAPSAMQGSSQGQDAPSGSGDWKAKAPMCLHGQRRAQEWTAKSGPNANKTQYTYFCPQPRDVPASEKCAPIDAITGKQWGAR